jgi:hypothetical protein
MGWVNRVLCVACLATLPPTQMAAQQPDFVGLDAVLLELEQDIQQAKLSDQPPFFIVEKVELTLKGERKVAVDGSASFSIPVFKVGADLSAKGGTTVNDEMKLTLVPRDRAVVGGTHPVNFTTLITQLKASLQKSTALDATRIEYSERWALERSGDGKVNIVVAKLGTEISQQNSQQIVFILCQTRNRADCIGS